MVSSALVCKVANTAAYCILDKTDPIDVASHVVAGYHEARPLSATELELVFPLICTRLAMSVANAARQAKDEPDKDYLRVSERAAWQMIEKLESICPRLAHYRFRDACGLAPLPHADAVVDWLDKHAEEAARVLPDALLDGGLHELDLSVASTELGGLDVLDDVERFTAHVFAAMRDAGARVGIGRYDEPRALYTSEAFRTGRTGRAGPGEGPEPRPIHIEAAVEWLVDQDLYGVSIALSNDGQPKPLSEATRCLLFRAIRELIVNVVKHARTTRVEVSMERSDDSIVIEVQDDGIGFDAPALNDGSARHGFGLFSIREHVEQIGGVMEIQSRPREGTCVRLLAPLDGSGI